MNPPESRPEIGPVRQYLRGFAEGVCTALSELDSKPFDERRLENERGGVGRPRVLVEGEVFEQAAVNETYAKGDRLPPAATERRPELVGRGFEAASVSIIVHPRNPFVPTTHANLRFFIASDSGNQQPDAWWFGGGFDLTPYYGFEEDVRHWHLTARNACNPFGARLYQRLKQDCDDYFYLPHRDEPRGVGGLFFDDLSSLEPEEAESFERCFALVRSVGDSFLPAYLPIVERRKDHPYTDAHRDFQLYRRGRYVEFNLACDRGTRYGLQIGGRTESILASLPPRATWKYDWSPNEDSEEAKLYTDFLIRRDWAAE